MLPECDKNEGIMYRRSKKKKKRRRSSSSRSKVPSWSRSTVATHHQYNKDRMSQLHGAGDQSEQK